MDETQEYTIRQVIEHLLEHGKLILGFSGLVTVVSAVVVMLLAPKFDASVLFMVSEPKLEISTRYIEPVKIRNYSELLTSNTVIEGTFRQLSGKLKKPPVPFDRMVLKRMVDVTIHRDSHIVELKVRALDPDDAALIANTAARVFIDHVTSILERSARNIQDLIARQIVDTTKKLQSIDDELAAFFRESKITELTIERELKLRQLDRFTTTVSEKQAELEGLHANISQLDNSLKEQSQLLTVQSYLGKNPLFRQEMAKLGPKELDALSSLTVTETVINEGYQNLWEQLAKNRAAEASLKKEIEKLNREIINLETDISRFPDLEIQYRKLSIQSDLYKNILKDLNQQIDEARVLVASKSGDVEIVDAALPPLKKSSPQRVQTVIFSAVLSFFIIVVFLMATRFLHSETTRQVDIDGGTD